MKNQIKHSIKYDLEATLESQALIVRLISNDTTFARSFQVKLKNELLAP